ncbi:MAG TPA: ABC transporter permease [Blastocatellia bacterium]|nr:ABC transporter permease [Blastocatellia bacterium]
MQTITQDLRYGLRMLGKRPGFTLVAVITLALGIGANTAIFSMVDALLINPLPFPQVNRLVALWEKVPSQGVERNETAIANYLDWQAQNQSFENISLYSWWNANLSGIDPPERLQGYVVTTNLLDTMKVQPLLGRGFIPEEGQPGKDQVVILSYGLWQRRFAGDPQIINQTVTINGIPRTVIGVMGENYQFPKGFDILAPFAFTPQLSASRGSHGNLTVARLKDGVSLAQAQADMDAIAGRLAEQNPQTNTGRGITVYTLMDDTVRIYKAALLVSLLAVGFVLLIACANVANLTMARAASRSKEIAVRLALGASRWRIMRQLITESVILSVAGGVAGILLALWGVDTLKAAMPGETVRYIIGWKNISINLTVLAYTLGLSLFVGILFGLAPALQASKPDLNETLKEGSGKTTASGHHRLRSTLVIAEVALALVLLVGAGLMVKSFWQILKTNPGFNGDNVLTMRMTLPRAKYADAAQRRAFYEQLNRQVATLPGVESVGLTNYIPLGGSNSSDSFLVEGVPDPPPGQEFIGRYRNCTPDYFKAMGIQVLNGRGFTEQDIATAPPVAVINETMARQYWPNGDAIGKRFRLEGPIAENPWRTVVGVIRDVKHELNLAVTPEYYFPLAQDPWSSMVLVAHTSGEPAALTPAIRAEVQAIDKDQPVFEVQTMQQVRSASTMGFSFTGALMSVFAGIALLLAGVGIYGVMSYTVTQRTREIGIRMALGARPTDVLKMVVRHGMGLTVTGLGIGTLGAWFMMKAMASLLFEVSANDLTIFAAVPIILTAVALLACYVPARRATKVDPMIALRYE